MTSHVIGRGAHDQGELPCLRELKLSEASRVSSGRILIHSWKPVEGSWQPSDFLPVMSDPGWKERVEALQRAAGNLADDLLVVLVGDMVTEEALPDLSNLAEPSSRPHRRDRNERHSVGPVEQRMDSGREPPRRPAEPLPVAVWPGEHACGRGDHPSFDQSRFRSPDGE